MSQSTSESKPSSYSLLTDNASPLERALEHTLRKHLDQVAPPLPQLRNANQTPESALPYLAADRMVTYWKKEDSVKIKKAQVASAQVERKKSGTREGISDALNAIGYGSDVRNRYDLPELPPFTLDVIAWKEDASPVNSELIDQLIEKLDDIKSTRDTIELSLVFGVETKVALGGAKAPSTNVSYTDAPAVLWPMPDADFAFGIAGGACPPISVNHLTVKATVIPDEPIASAAPAAGSYSLSVSPITARAIT
ncbi:phage tail protein I [Vibrio sp. S9_S30]|uniref:phage tail protein I n=1 Tax=Vibrio sp. S9_S30 TaxID=2720226 RepID=UPI00168137D0|nr:phage tail protein I [Vibrio sp. S9_S30]MBD1559505.1 phage tail protein I [Vibrio sp. S9_S30]